jgi:hypothetical protein
VLFKRVNQSIKATMKIGIRPRPEISIALDVKTRAVRILRNGVPQEVGINVIIHL